MCGILGTLQQKPSLTPDQFGRMLDTLAQRGPDGRGVQSLDNGRVLLGHRRLAIIDLSPAGAQPLCNEDETVWLTFNGEIYNYRILRQQLLELGHRFRSQSDSEVIVHAYEEWGRDCVRRFSGIFAFGLWDSRTSELLLARDPLGVKPLYYGQYAGRFTFASQPKAIVCDPAFTRQIDPDGWRDYFAFGYVPHDRSIFSAIAKLPAGHTAVLRNGTLHLERYWQLEYRPVIHDPRDAIAAVCDKLKEAVRAQMLSDVPVGCFLSGGIDSSLLVSLAHELIPELRTFTVGFREEASDEREYARAVAQHFKTRHFESMMERTQVEQQLQDLQEHFDEPFDPNGPMPFLEVARLARSNGTVVALGGDGADEIFAGYLRYDDFDCPAWATGSLKSGWRKLRGWGLLGPRISRAPDAGRYFAYEGCLPDDAQRHLFRDKFMKVAQGEAIHMLERFFPADIPAVAAAQYADMHLYLVDHILCKVDRASMAHGVEARVPFLDPELVSLAFQIPLSISYRHGERKALLKQVASQYLPNSVVSARKKGFSSPLGSWSDMQLAQWSQRLLDGGVLMQHGILRPDWSAGLGILEQQYGIRPRWLLLTAELWARRWLA